MDPWRKQNGILTKTQALASGLSLQQVRGRVERGHWQRIHPGVYATFSGALTWKHRAWAALLYSGEGAALGFESAAYAGELITRPPRTFDILVPPRRRVRERPRLRIHRRLRHADVVRGWPPRTIPAETVLDLVSRATSPTDVVGAVTAGIRADANPEDVLTLLNRRRQQRWRTLLTDLLVEVDEGIESPLEWHFRHDVERPHGLPAARLQIRERLPFGVIRADARYPQFKTRAELDGDLAHRGGRTDQDTWRDNEVSINSAELTLRYRWIHVVGTPCRTADQLTRALRRGGWTGVPHPCRNPSCDLVADGRVA